MVDASQRLSTGLAGLDAQLSGGVPAGSVHILLSEPMNAQELLAYHFAGAGGVAQYFSTDQEEHEIREGLERIGAQDADVEVVALEGIDQRVEPREGVQRIIIDSFSHYTRGRGWEEAQRIVEGLRGTLRENGGTLLLTVSPGLHSEEEVTLMKLWADGVMELGLDRQGFGLYPFLKITKMRGVPDSARFLLFKETERGLFMESTRRVF